MKTARMSGNVRYFWKWGQKDIPRGKLVSIANNVCSMPDIWRGHQEPSYKTWYEMWTLFWVLGPPSTNTCIWSPSVPFSFVSSSEPAQMAWFERSRSRQEEGALSIWYAWRKEATPWFSRGNPWALSPSTRLFLALHFSQVILNVSSRLIPLVRHCSGSSRFRPSNDLALRSRRDGYAKE